jgi:hypothetical protein
MYKVSLTSSVLAAGLAFMSGSQAFAQSNQQVDAQAQANNPLADFTAVNLHNYYIGEQTGSDKSANQFWLRYAKPFELGSSKWLMRASLPVNSYPVAPDGDRETGLGDLNAFAAYLVDVSNPAISFGVGPLLIAPTAAEDALGSGKWSAGFANVLFNATSKKFQYGYLLTWSGSFAGDDDRKKVSSGAAGFWCRQSV